MTPSHRTLVSLKVSPWSERARWALDHHGIAYDAVEHVPVMGERRLRRLVGPGKPRATVPVLIDGDEVLSDSWDIAVYADRVGSGTKLIPREHEDAIRGWTTLADETMFSGRALVLAALLGSPAALDEANPPFVPRWLRPMLRPVARRVTKRLAKKYDVLMADRETHVSVLRRALDRIRAARTSGEAFLLGSFTYADIAMATLLQGVSPVDARFIRLGPATRAAWTQAELARDYADLLRWRDERYEGQRQLASRRSG